MQGLVDPLRTCGFAMQRVAATTHGEGLAARLEAYKSYTMSITWILTYYYNWARVYLCFNERTYVDLPASMCS